MKKNKIIFALLLLFFPMFVFAGSISVNKSSIDLQTGGTATFTITAKDVTGQFSITSSNSSIVSVTSITGVSDINGNLIWLDVTGDDTKIVTVTIKAGSTGGSAKINVKPEDAVHFSTNADFTDTKYVNVKVTVPHVASSNNLLGSLSITGGTLNPSFNAVVTEYSATVNAASTTVNAACSDPNARGVSGTGNRNLNYGNNRIDVVCTAENGDAKTYTINITRPDNRSTNNFLKSLSVEGATLSPAFNKNTTTYSIPQVDVASITINASAEDSKAVISGAGKRNLDYGDNSLKIDVKAENQSVKTYVIKVNRKDTRETVNTLTALSVEGCTISPSFSESKTEYSCTVAPNVSSVKINATKKSAKSSFVKNYGPRTVNLNYGENKVLIQVQAENTGSKYRKSYTIKITRTDDRDTDSSLSSLSVDQGGFTFDKNTKEYTVNVNYPIDKINVTATASSAKATVEGAGEHELQVGQNVIGVTVTAENGAKTTYAIKVNRLPEDATPVEEIDFIQTISIDGMDLGFAKNKYRYEVEIAANEDKLDINPVYYDGITGEILGNENLVDGSIVKIIARTKYGASMEYVIVIKKKTDWMTGTNSIYVGCGALIAFAVVFFTIKSILSNKLNPAGAGMTDTYGTTYIAPDDKVVDASYSSQDVEPMNEAKSNNVPEVDTPDMDEFSNNNMN